MAIIPRDSKSNSSEDKNLGLEVVVMIFAFVVLGNMFISPFIHAKLRIPFFVFIGLLCWYMLSPSNLNKGKLGYHRVLITVRYTLKKIEYRKRVKR
ncbi:hypothetical protein [Breznakia pachnodae]|uniref:Uncharacterized protein n=1 Tax=Breznakia pachnodae TaxID=265178 RepID=A0ABU0DZQ1_9FIRM|nr:hypothetical protein [Breznakia pachnodae]MDQ0359989.1 hypothetical protein [Breznakia pachnodae]